MPSSVKVPWSQPIANPVATRVPPNIVVPETVAPEEWPFQFSWPGMINAANVNSPAVRANRSRTISTLAWTLENLGTTIQIAIQRNGGTIYLRTLSSGADEESIVGGPLSISAGQQLRIRVTNVGDGTSFNAWWGIK